MLHDWISMKDQLTIGELLDTIIDGSGYRLFIDDGTAEGRDRWANVMELRNVAKEFDELTLSEFLEQVALVADIDDLEEDPDAPTLLTLHAAKGLEFPVVFIVGLEEGLLPHSRSLEEADELAEERRLFYVGLTRAMDRIYLSHAFRRTTYGGTEVSVPSRFIHDIPEELMDGGSSGQRRRESRRRVSSWNWSSETSKRSSRSNTMPGDRQRTTVRKVLPEPYSGQSLTKREIKPTLTEAQFRTGQQVQHQKFGKGIVIESKLTGNDEEVVVAFSDSEIGIKKLVASLAKLEIIE
jgi:DNA helicase-2/ATP-dependent DNA helicase PcrA